jgi:hypothetical protein
MEDLPDTFDLERPRPRRWVTIVAVVVPVIAVVISAAWFVRAFVAPPTIMIPAPMVLAAAPPPVDVQASDARNPATAEAPAGMTDRIADRMTDSSSNSVYTPGLPAFASLAAAPPTPKVESAAAPVMAPPPITSAPQPTPALPPWAAGPTVMIAPPAPSAATAIPDPAPEPQAEIQPGEPIQGPIPIPPRKPRLTVAHVAIGAVPLPRPRPAETTVKPDSDAQYFERHTVQ